MFKKLIFSFICGAFLSFDSEARNIIVLNISPKAESRDLIQKIIVSKLGIPKNLITTIWSEKCLPEKESILQICLNSQGELSFPVMKKDVLKNTFGPIMAQMLNSGDLND